LFAGDDALAEVLVLFVPLVEVVPDVLWVPVDDAPAVP